MKRRTRSQDPRPSRSSLPRDFVGWSALELARLEFTLEALCPGISSMSDALGFDCLYALFNRANTPELESSVNEVMTAYCVLRGLEVRFASCEKCGGSCFCGDAVFSLWSVRESRLIATY